MDREGDDQYVATAVSQGCGYDLALGLLENRRGHDVYTAHDMSDRRTGDRHGLWNALFHRFARVVAHSESGRDVLESYGVPAAKLRVIPHPIIPSDPPRTDD